MVWKNSKKNSASWQKDSDEWVATMNKSKENKEKYQEYLKKITGEALSYRDWLRQINE